MAPDSVRPLRINKPYSSNSSPSKMDSPRPLSEISPMGIRRNSPSWNQATKGFGHNMNSSPFDASPTNSQPRFIYKDHDSPTPSHLNSENDPYRGSSPSPTRRTSLEKLQKASRVKNSNMFAWETSNKYDPSNSPVVDRPLASGRPLSFQYQGNAFGGTGLERGPDSSPVRHRRTESQTDIAFQSAPRTQQSPQKSSLSNNSRKLTPEDVDSRIEDVSMSSAANTPRAALRQHKTVSFDQAPPQINEYEMITPDPSSVASGSREGSHESDQFDLNDHFDRDSEDDHEDSFDDSLEDTGKTPVVLPEDWRFMSPEAVHKDLAETFEDPFENAGPEETSQGDVSHSSSTTSNGGEVRPLPPIPSLLSTTNRTRGQSEDILASPASYTRRNSLVHTPPRPASVSKADILKMRESPMPLDERLRLLEIQDREKKHAEEAKALLSHSLKPTTTVDTDLRKDEKSAEPEKVEKKGLKAPPRISRESILRNMSFGTSDEDCDSEDDCVPVHVETGTDLDRGTDVEELDYSNLDPDVPIPSRECPSSFDDDENMLEVKQEEDVNGKLIDMYSSKARGELAERSPSRLEDYDRDTSVIRHAVDCNEASDAEEDVLPQKTPSTNINIKTSEADAPSNSETFKGFEDTRMSLPDFATFGNDDFGLSFQSYLSPSPPETSNKAAETTLSPRGTTNVDSPKSASPLTLPSFDRPSTPEQVPALAPPSWPCERSEEEIATPESVIHRPFEEATPEEDANSIPDGSATVKAHGSKLKTRVSMTPADIETLAAHRRHVSSEQPPVVPDMPKEFSAEAHMNEETTTRSSLEEESHRLSMCVEEDEENSTMKLEMPMDGSTEQQPGLGLDQEFDRLLEAKKKGYLTRQNTKVIVASNRHPSNESKASAATADSVDTGKDGTAVRNTKLVTGGSNKQKNQTWTTEPWNGRMRRHSTRKSDIVPGMKMALGPIPPLPGTESNSSNAMIEEEQATISHDVDPSEERGRLFVKVVGVKGLDLQLPRNERSWFQLTLDNGLHCVTTAWLELGKTAPIGQEFELTVFDELEFQLTLQTKLERPQSQASSVSSAGSPTKSPKKGSALSRILTSPKKRREQEKKQQVEEALAAKQKQDQVEALRANAQPTAWDLLHNVVGPDGSFARAYVSLKDHEQQAFGRPHSVEIPCFNEWAVDDRTTSNSARSKMGGIQRKPPYKIGKLDLQLLYVPKPKGVKDEDMPQSMSACVKQLKEAESTISKQWEGHLSQQGGDCPYWRRRFFKLNGANLTSYHESTRQRRANINLAKAIKLIDDRSSLAKPEGSPTKKGRRKSAFAEEEEGYMFVEEGFRIRFANGEVIDFYADNREDKEGWMKALVEVVGKDIQTEKMSWTRVVLAREKDLVNHRPNPDVKTRDPPTRPASSTKNTNDGKPLSSSESAATLAVQSSTKAPPPLDKSPRHQASDKVLTKSKASPAKATTTSPLKSNQVSPSKLPSPSKKPVPRQTTQAASAKRQGVRSMIF